TAPLISGRRNDILSFELQEGVSRMLGLKDTRRFLSSEIMMRLLYRKTHDVHDSLKGLISACSRQYVRTYLSIPVDWSVKRISDEFFISRGEITVRTMDTLKNPDKVLEIFRIFAANPGKKLSQQVREFLRERSVYFPSRKRPSRRAVGSFLEILRSSRVYETLREMNDTGVLGRFIPEFGRLRHLVIHEPYHRYTVDEHTLMAIRNLEALKKTRIVKFQNLRDVMQAVRQDSLYLAILLHDVGKAESGRRGRRRMSHEEEGYNRIKAFLERLGLEKEERISVEFLVKNHILLSRLALTRDPDAPETIEQLAGAAGNEANLNALYLMTYADMSAVNPDFWTDWKAYILHDLYTRAAERLRGNRLYCCAITDPTLREFVQDMPERYLISNSPETVSSDYEMSRGIETTLLSLSIAEREDGTAELSVITKDVPGLFFRIAGVLGRKGLNILRARFYTGESGLVIDRIILSNWRELWWEGLEDRIRDGLIKALLQPAEEGREVSASPFIPLRIVPVRFESFVEIDNETSGECSVMEVFTSDRLGLLYEISSRLHSLGVDIISAVINTEDGIAQDVFYLQAKGEKLGSENTMDLLCSVKEIASSLTEGGE
ncbi:MAG: HD domain-containing protein, partial [Thermodesulfovibrionales bacterium]